MERPATLAEPPIPTLVIEKGKTWSALSLGEVWAYRELLYFLVWRDIKVRYKQTLLGATWAILQPLLTMAVFTLFFGRIAGVPSDGVPYPLFSFAGLLVWGFFAQGISLSSNSLVGSANLITKIYFPRLVIPTASVAGGLVDLAVAFPVLGVLMVHYRVFPGSRVLALVPLLALAVITTTGVGLWLSALNVEYRDVRYAVPFLVQLWLFCTPVIYPASSVLPRLHAFGVPDWVYGLNPMAGVVEGFRWACLGTATHPGPIVLASAATGIVVLVSGAWYFRSVEREFADVV